MATVVRYVLAGCEGFRVESSQGLLGWVEETWLEGYKAGQSKRPLIFIMRSIIAWRI